MIKEFYRKALPTQGVLCVTVIDPLEPDEAKRARNHFAQTVPELLEIIDSTNKERYDVFVALNSFTNHKRKASEGAYARSFFLDLDVGPEPKKYFTQSYAIESLVNFVNEVGLPPPVVINSGTGIHAYWIFDQDIPSNIWKVYAQKFKEFCLEKLLIDPTVTADIARIMRCPETLNHKTSPPKASFIMTDIQVYDFEAFKEFLGEINIPVNPDIFAGVERGLDEDTLKISNLDQNLETLFTEIVYKSLNNNGCAQIKNIIINAATLPEPLWHSGLSIARQCLDWETAIHTMSEDYPRYDFNQTLHKANETYNKPHSCKIFEDRNPGGCDGCPHKGKITNPLALGRYVKEDSPTNPIRLKQNPQSLPPPFPKSLQPFFRGAHGGVYYRPLPVIDKQGNKTQEPDVLISQYDIYPIKRVYHGSEGEYLLWRYVLPKDPMREFMVPTKLHHSKDEVIKLFSEQGLTFNPSSHANHFMTYITKWSQHLIGLDAAEQMRTQMGWTDDDDGFVIGNTEIRRDGTILRTATSPMINSIAKLLTNKGSYLEWQTAVNMLNAPSLEMHCFGVLCGFGSPLMRYMSTNGVSVGFTGESGSGKTGTLYSAVSIFGDPEALSMVGGKDQATANALIGMYLALKNIMLGLDESSNRKAEEVSNLIYQVSSGQAKQRMRSDKNALREHERSARLIAMMTQNQSLTDKLMTIKDSPDGELARYIEFQMNIPQAFINDPWLSRKIYEGVKANYGWAGPDFIQKLFKLGDAKIEEISKKWLLRFEKDFGKITTFRFYENLITACFTGGEIACDHGIINFNLDKIYLKVLENISVVKTENKINDVDYISILGEFQNKFHNGTLFIKGGQVVREPKNPLVARIELDVKTMYVAAREIKIYLAELQVNRKMFFEELKKAGILIFEGKKRLSKNWAGMSDLAPVQCYGFKVDVKDPV